MWVKILVGILGLCLGVMAWADDTKILAFEQFIAPEAGQSYSAKASAIAPNAQMWSVVYMVLQTNQVPDDTVLDFKVVPQGILFKNNPAKKIEEYGFEGIRLAQKKEFSFSQYADFAALIQDQTGKKIQDASVFDVSRAHVYARVEDWVPEYNSPSAQLSIELGQMHEMDVKALYILFGEGEKPKDLAAIAQLDPLVKSQFQSEATQDRHRVRSEMREAKFAIFLVMIGVGIFLGWYRFKR
ncbi:hypothetical protein B9T33_01495 [Acinetobacter sp. ANC 5054]|uniref:hypothetical protein n=1 Tax=Acinetobacter sp. ANC 5054 TaxID=1977877 RepID=UPI000A3463AB|nr:hypothetical protein [Acinetobacter sp. ANC 5054]OTG84486.1 hypothetical protein B9T33_01495 [Acinetobacter sp. ANC 5054]